MKPETKLCHYVSDYIEEEKHRNNGITPETVSNAMEAFEGGAHDGQGYIVHIVPDDQATRPMLKAAPNLLRYLKYALFELERCTGLEDALEPIRAAIREAEEG